MDFESEIRTLETEIASLKGEIGPLQSSHDALLRQVTAFESSNNLRPLPRYRNSQRRGIGGGGGVDDPPLIADSYFDDSLKAYFAPASTKSSTKSQKARTEPSSAPESLAAIQSRALEGSYALLESLHRFGGITAFPINDNLYDTSEDALLGLRFDVLSHSTRAYLAPHYVILRRARSKDGLSRWQVFRYTTPAYLSLDSLKHHLNAVDENKGLQKFCESIRNALVATQHRHDTIHSIKSLTWADLRLEGTGTSREKVFASVESDLQCRRVVFNVAEPKFSIELLLGATSVDSVSSTLHEEASSHVRALLANATIESLQTAFSKTLAYLLRQQT